MRQNSISRRPMWAIFGSDCVGCKVIVLTHHVSVDNNHPLRIYKTEQRLIHVISFQQISPLLNYKIPILVSPPSISIHVPCGLDNVLNPVQGPCYEGQNRSLYELPNKWVEIISSCLIFGRLAEN
jgi:hypothetical protein